MSVGRIVCVGDLMVDVLARLPGELALGSDTPAPVHLVGGGSAANTAAWLAHAGVPTTLFARVGDDVAGRTACAELTDGGVDLAVSVDPDRPTGTCIVLVDVRGERTMIPSAGANDGLGAAPLPDGLFGPDRHLHVSGYALFGTGSRPAAERALAAARAGGAPISVDAASAAPLSAFGAERFLHRVGPALLFANRDEAAVLTGADDPTAAARALAARCGEAVVKGGADGAVWSDGTDVVAVPAAQARVRDSTGAGDAFAAGVLAGRIAGADVAAALRRGTALAARALERTGARPPRPGQELR